MPALVLAVHVGGADVQTGDVVRTVSTLLLPDTAVGDYVVVSAGSITERITADEAEERRQIFDLLLAAIDEQVDAG